MKLDSWPVLLLAAALSGACARAEEPAPKADETGMVPGDVVTGNMSTFPGHVGIYIGKWKSLPEPLQQKYAKVLDQVVLYSKNEALKDSFLVADSYAPSVRLRSFAEQFTGYFSGGPRTVKPKGALAWEGNSGAAIAWPNLAIGDLKRWRIVEEALKMCELKVAYEDAHKQLDTTRFANAEYKDMKLDCIAFCHVAYNKGAGISLDVSWWPIHTPAQMLEHATEKNLKRAVMFEPVYAEAVALGKWGGEYSQEFKGALTKGPFGLCIEPHPRGLQVHLMDPTKMQLLKEGFPERIFAYSRDKDDNLSIKFDDPKDVTFTISFPSPDELAFNIFSNAFKKTKPMYGVLKRITPPAGGK